MPDLDAKKIWQDALARGQTEPGLIIATADFLVERGKFEHAAEFLKANLRHGVVARPWVYESLTIALKLSKGSLEEIERAQLSTIDLEPRNADGYLKASRAMADSKRWDRAVAYCRQASLLEPNAPQPYAEALIYAERSKNTADMAWAAGNLLQRDWPLQNQNLHVQAEDHLKALRKILEAEKRAGSADKLLAGVAQQRQRDLVVTLSWQGSADLDLEVAEPIGSVCSFLSRQTTGGGTLIGDTLSDMTRETYVAAEAFPGEYAITLRHIWGRPLGSKATLEVIEHEGTPRKKTLFRDTIVFDRTHTVKVTLKDGRRTSVAQVPAAPPRSEVKAKVQSDRALNQLRALADSDQGDADAGVRGGMEPIAAPMLARSTERASLQAAKISSNVSSGMEMTLQPVVTSDRRVVGMTLNPVFQTLGKSPTTPVVVNPVIPGAGR